MTKMKLILMLTIIFQTYIMSAQDPCTIIAKNGIYDYEHLSTEEESFREIVKWVHNQNFSSSKEMNEIGVTLGLDLKKLPIDLGFNSEKYNFNEFKNEVKKYVSDTNSKRKSTVYQAKKVNTELARIITNCVGVVTYIKRDSDNNINLALSYKSPQVESKYFTLKDIQVYPKDVAEIGEIPYCSHIEDGSIRNTLPLKISSHCAIPIIWKDKSKSFMVTLSTDALNHETVFDISPEPIIVTCGGEKYKESIYHIETYTTKTDHAETDDGIEIRIMGENGYIIKALDDINRNDREKGDRNSYLIRSNEDIGKIQKVELIMSDARDEGNDLDDWKIGWISIEDMNRKIIHKKTLNKWIGDGKYASTGNKAAITF